MKFLIDQNRSPRLADQLRQAGHDALHTLDLGLERAEDDELLLLAANEQRVIVSGDTDFGALLALLRRRSPSVISNCWIYLDAASLHHQEHLDDLAEDLDQGAVVVVSDARIRVRRLPLLHDDEN